MKLNREQAKVIYNLMSIPFITIKHYVHAIDMKEEEYKDQELVEKLDKFLNLGVKEK